jgi:benzoyl-CoA reductase subunit B
MNEVLHLPPWMNEWMASEARRCSIDAAVILLPGHNRLSVSGTKMTRRTLESAGVPTLELEADMVDAQRWERGAMVEYVSEFLQTRVHPARAPHDAGA